MFLGAKHQVRIVGAGGCPAGPAQVERRGVIRIGDVAVRAVGFRIERAVDVDRHPAIRDPALHHSMMPKPVGQRGRAAQRALRSIGARDAEHQAPSAERHAEVPILVEAVAIDEHVSAPPRLVRPAGRSGGGVLARQRLHPPFECEVRGTDVGRWSGGRGRRVVDGDLDTIQVAIAVAVIPKREPARREIDRRQRAPGVEHGQDLVPRKQVVGHVARLVLAHAVPGQTGVGALAGIRAVEGAEQVLAVAAQQAPVPGEVDGFVGAGVRNGGVVDLVTGAVVHVGVGPFAADGDVRPRVHLGCHRTGADRTWWASSIPTRSEGRA